MEKVYNHFNKLINTLKKEETIETGEKYPWLDDTDERKHMPDREILEKYVDLSNSCLHKKEKEEVMDMFCKYKEVFSLGDEIVTWPNIEVEINVTDRLPFLLEHIMLLRRIRKL